MIHPNEVAIDYIWEYFQQCFFEEKTISLNEKIEKIAMASMHRPFNPDSEQHQNFITKQLQRIDQLSSEYSLP